MKKYYVLFALLTLSLQGNGQLHQGAILTGGNISYYGSDRTDDYTASINAIRQYKLNTLVFSPNVGYLITESLLMGIGLTYEYEKQSAEVTRAAPYNERDVRISNMYFVNPYLTKFSKINDKMYFTATLNVLLGFGKEDSEHLNTVDYETDIFEYRVNLTSGLTYFISNKWAVNASIGQLFYNRERQEINIPEIEEEVGEIINKNYGINVSFNTFLVGFKYFSNNKGAEE